MKKAFVFFAEGFEEIEALTIVDVLRRAEIPVVQVSVTSKKEVAGAHGITIIADALFEEVNFNDSEILILPGGMPGSSNLQAHEGLAKVIQEKEQNQEALAAICAAPMVLGQLGVLKGKEAVCYPGFEDQLIDAQIKSDSCIQSGNVITGRGPGAALDFSLKLVETIKGKAAADQLAEGMLVQTWN